MTPHKHAELIKAWADGAEIEFHDGAEWAPTQKPKWNPGTEYRIKPEKKWYRVAELKEYCFVKGSLIIIRTEESEKAVDPSTPGSMVKRWITDRIYYE